MDSHWRSSALLIVLILATCRHSMAQCQPEWLADTFHSGSGPNVEVRALAAIETATGPRLYAGGRLTWAGNVPSNRVAQWDGKSWSAMGDGMNDTVHALAVFEHGGSGPVLFAGGEFTEAGGVTANHVARWDGSTWIPVGPGMNGPVYALAKFTDDLGRPFLIAGGDFTTAGGVPATRLARWNGQSWSRLSTTGANDTVHALAVHNDGEDDILYVGGRFTLIGGISARSIARWDGETWEPLGSGMTSSNQASFVYAIAVFDSGTGPEVYAGGSFSSAGGSVDRNLARWDGENWTNLWLRPNGTVWALSVFDDGSGEALYAAGGFNEVANQSVNRIVRWDGQTASALGSGLSTAVYALLPFQDEHGQSLITGGNSGSAGGVPTGTTARWNGQEWRAISTGLSDSVYALEAVRESNQTVVYAGGTFRRAGGTVANRVARWDGQVWSPMGDGMDHNVRVLRLLDTGTGPVLYAAGAFTTADGHTVNGIATWSGQSWAPVGTGLGSSRDVRALEVFDDGQGAQLYAAGSFSESSGAPGNNIARWDGQAWQPLGMGTGGVVNALAVFDDGSGLALYVGGSFQSVSGAAIRKVARWDGQSWSQLGFNNFASIGQVRALVVFDDGTGPSLYAGGEFSNPHQVARWTGGPEWEWLSFGSWKGHVFDLKVFDDGTGSALYAGGTFTRAADVDANRVARWDGQSWSPLGSGTNARVWALASMEHGSERGLYVGGDFITAGDGASRYIARWGCPPPPICYADCDDNGTLNIDDFLCFINEFAAASALPPAQQMVHYANCTGATVEPVLTIDDFLCFINEFAQGCP